METDLRLYGNELNYFTTFFKYVFSFLQHIAIPDALNSIGYMIMLYPSCIIISHVGPSIWLPACEVSQTRIVYWIYLTLLQIMWGIFTCCLSTATSAKQVKATPLLASGCSVSNDVQVYGLRFLIGFFEGATWPGYFTIIR